MVAHMDSVKLASLMAVVSLIACGSMADALADPMSRPVSASLTAYSTDPLVQPMLLSQVGLLQAVLPEPNVSTQSGEPSRPAGYSSLVALNTPVILPSLLAKETDGSFGLRRHMDAKDTVANGEARISLTDLGHRLQAMPKAKRSNASSPKARRTIASINPDNAKRYDLNISGGNNRGKLFGTLSIATNMKKARNRWVDLEHRSGNPMPVCKGAACFSNRWHGILTEAKSLPARKRLLHVNRSINKLITYKSDMQAFRSRDYWASPAEAYRAGGDCEDFAIAKYWMLREIGYKPNEMRLVVLRDTMVNQWHAVLAVRHGDDWAILDNRFSRIRMSGEMPHLKPVYTVNEVGTWMQKPKTGKSLNQLVARK